MSRWPLLTIIGILAAMLIGTIHAFVESQLARPRPRTAVFFPRDWF